jgi:hypothetical protein
METNDKTHNRANIVADRIGAIEDTYAVRIRKRRCIASHLSKPQRRCHPENVGWQPLEVAKAGKNPNVETRHAGGVFEISDPGSNETARMTTVT